MRNMNSKKYPGYLTYEIFMSPAFRNLKPAAKDVLIQVFFEVEMSPRSKRSKHVSIVTNRKEIILTYAEIEARLGYSVKTIWASFRQILAHGFLEVVKHGGGAKGDYQIYGIIEDWRKWEPGQVIRSIQKKGTSGWQRKKISCSTGKPPRSSTGKPVTAKNRGALPTGKTVFS